MDMGLINPLGRLQSIFRDDTPDKNMGAPVMSARPSEEIPSAINQDAMPSDMSSIKGMQIDKALSSMMPAQRHAMYDKLLEMINNAPERPKPSFMGRLSAGMIGLGGGSPAEMDEAKFGGYNRQRRDYETNLENVYKGAALEDRMNQGDMRDWYNQQRINDLGARNDRLYYFGQGKLDQGQQKIDLAAEKQAHDYEIAKKKLEHARELANGGTLYRDKRTGQVWINRRNGNVDETDLNDYTEDELQDLKTQGKLKEIQAEGTRDAKIQQIKDAAAKERTDAAIAGRKEVAQIPKKGGTGGGNSNANSAEIAKQRARVRRAQEYIDANPGTEKWITIKNGVVTIGMPRSSMFGSTDADQKMHNAATAYIDQDYQGSGATSSGEVKPGEGSTTTPAAKLPPPTADAALMNDAIAEIDKENARRAAAGNKEPQIKKTKDNIDKIMAQLKARKEKK